jgi:hypothetical protein
MTKFNNIFPDAEHLDQVEFKGSELLLYHGGVYNKHCWHCGESTNWIDINFQAPLCSEECFDAKWDEYFKASAGGDYLLYKEI